MIIIKGFLIENIGDESACISGETYELKENFIFENLFEAGKFINELKKLFQSYIGDNIRIWTFEELEKMEEQARLLIK